MIILSALGMIACYSYYTIETCKVYFNDEDAPDLEWSINKLKAGSFTALTVILIISSFIMLRRLKNRFYGLYTDYGKYLWIVVLS